ncbi:MAG: hypothetical protein ABI612_05715 [Betaproteobacteria bacterium]
MTIGKLVLGASLILIVSIPAAAQIPQGTPTIARNSPVDRAETSVQIEGRPAVADAPAPSTSDLDDQPAVEPDSSLDEYLLFHAQVVEDNTLSSLLPWSGLRVHVN